MPPGPPPYPMPFGGQPRHGQPPYPGYQPMPYQPVPAPPQYRPLRRIALVSIVLMGLTVVAAVIQAVLMWRSYEDVKRFIYGLLSDDELRRTVETVAGSGPLLNLLSYLSLGTAIAFLIWLWQARENAEFLQAQKASGGRQPVGNPHRHAQGWIVGSWFCPIVQFWYPLQIVQDVTSGSEPPDQPGVASTGRMRALLYGWWATWTGFWVVLVGGGGLALIGFVVWLVRLVDAADTANETGDYIDFYDLQDFLVRFALGVNIGFTVATVLLMAAGVAASILLLRITRWQHDQATTPPPAITSPPPEPPRYAPRPRDHTDPGPSFPSYGPR